MNVLDGADEVNDPLLTGDPANEENVRPGRVDLVLRQDRAIGCRSILVQVDAVVDDPDLLVGNSVKRVDVLAHGGRDGDDAIGVLIRGFLDPGAGVISRAKLLDLPGAMGLERVRREYQAGSGELPSQAATEVTVPGMAMDDVDIPDHPRHDQVAEHRLQEPLVLGILKGECELGVDPLDPQVSLADVLVAKADHGDLVGSVIDAGQLPGEVLDVDPCAPVDIRRVFVGEDRDPHWRSPASVTAHTDGPSVRDPTSIVQGPMAWTRPSLQATRRPARSQ